MKTRTFYFSLVLATVFSLIPGWVLAAKVGDKPSNQQTFNKPIQVDTTKLTKPPANNLPPVKELTKPSVDVKAATRRPDKLPKVEPIIDIKEGSAGTRKIATEPPVGGAGAIFKPPQAVDPGNARGIQEADQARQIKDMQGVMDAVRNVPGAPERGTNRNLNLGIGGGGSVGPNGNTVDWSKLPGHDAEGLENAHPMPDPTTPRKNPANAPGDGLSGAPTGPASSPRDAMGGAAGLHVAPALGQKLPGSVQTVRTGDYTERTHTYRDSDGWHQVVDTFRNDGTSSQARMDITNAGMSGSRTEYDENGNVLDREVFLPDGPAGNPDPENTDPDGKWARWMAKFSGQRPDLNLKNPDQVNPGPEGGTSDSKGPRLVVPEDQLVINPDPNTISAQGAAPDARTAEMLRRQMEEIGRGPGPDPHPGDGRGRGDTINTVVPDGKLP